MPKLIYRKGQKSLGNFTPRKGKDTVGLPGVKPGLSIEEDRQGIVLLPKERLQYIDLDLLTPSLAVISDDAAKPGGRAGHGVIAPVDEFGEVDQQLLEEWAASRGQDPPHVLTRLVRDAVVDEERG